jgi:hypothetical protein
LNVENWRFPGLFALEGVRSAIFFSSFSASLDFQGFLHDFGKTTVQRSLRKNAVVSICSVPCVATRSLHDSATIAGGRKAGVASSMRGRTCSGICERPEGFGNRRRNQPETMASENRRNIHGMLLLRGNSIISAGGIDRESARVSLCATAASSVCCAGQRARRTQ